MDDDAIPGRQLVTVADPLAEIPPDASASALITPEMRLDLMAARLEGLAAQNRRLSHDNDDLRQENRRLLASAAQLRGENLALSRALTPTRATADELSIFGRQIETFGQTLQADRDERARAAEQAVAARDAREQAAEHARTEYIAVAEAAAANAASTMAGMHTTLSADTIEQLAEAITRQAKDERYEGAASMLRAMQRSTSWRLTKPVRVAGGVFKKS